MPPPPKGEASFTISEIAGTLAPPGEELIFLLHLQLLQPVAEKLGAQAGKEPRAGPGDEQEGEIGKDHRSLHHHGGNAQLSHVVEHTGHGGGQPHLSAGKHPAHAPQHAPGKEPPSRAVEDGGEVPGEHRAQKDPSGEDKGGRKYNRAFRKKIIR